MALISFGGMVLKYSPSSKLCPKPLLPSKTVSKKQSSLFVESDIISQFQSNFWGNGEPKSATSIYVPSTLDTKANLV